MAGLKQLLPLAILYGVKNVVDVEDPENTPYLRALFGVVQTLVFCIYGFLYFKIQSAKDQTQLKCKKKDLDAPNPFGMEQEGGDEELEMTYQEYDMKELLKAVKQSALQAALVGFMHFKMEYKIPLIMTSCMSLVNLPDNNLLKVYLFGNTELERPFPSAPSPFAALLNPGGEEEPEAVENDKKKKKKKEAKKDK